MMKTSGMAGAEAAEVSVANGQIVRTVVVDDSPMMLKTLTLVLEQEGGIEVVGTATDGVKGMRRVIELWPDLVLMDVRLPGLNGIDATRRIKARLPAPAVIVVTSDDSAECRAQATAAGSDGFVTKNEMFTQLPAAIQKLFPAKARLRPDDFGLRKWAE
jgi:DNA-binding NarL/FixJ family response regulator